MNKQVQYHFWYRHRGGLRDPDPAAALVREPAGRGHPLQPVPGRSEGRQDRRGPRHRQVHRRQLKEAKQRQDASSSPRGCRRTSPTELRQISRQILRRGAEHLPQRPALLGAADGAVLRRLVLRVPPHRRQPGLGAGGFMAIGRSKAKVYVETDTKVTFADVAGVDEAKEELKEVVDFLKDPEALRPARRRACRRACCWSGRPAPARRCWRAPSPARRACRSSRSAARSSSRCSSASARRACATSSSRRGSKAPAIIFIDELDALGRARGAYPGLGGHDEKEQTLNQLLVELDGFDSAVGRGPARGHQPAGDPRPRAAARRPLRPPGAGRPARQGGPRRDPQGAPEEGEARRRTSISSRSRR